MNTHKGNRSKPGLTPQLENFVAALKGGTPHGLRGKVRSAAAAGGTRSGRGGAPLDTYANNVNTTSEASPSTAFLKPAEADLGTAAGRYAKNLEAENIRASVRFISVIPRVRKCAVVKRRAAGVGMAVELGADSEVRIAGWRGTYTCASVWACPRCSKIISGKRKDEVSTAINGWTSAGADLPTYSKAPYQVDGGGYVSKVDGTVFDTLEELTAATWMDRTGELLPHKPVMHLAPTPVKHDAGKVVFLTLTMRHRRRKVEDDQWGLEELWDGLSSAYRRMTNDRFFKGNIHAQIRTVEVTYSAEHGWHPHIHALLFVSNKFAERLEANTGRIVDAWIRSVEKEGYSALVGGQDFRLVDGAVVEGTSSTLAGYVTKAGEGWGAAMEVTGWTMKRAGGKGATPVEMYNALHAHGVGDKLRDLHWNMDELAKVVPAEIMETLSRYREFERASHGRRQLTWSRGLRDAFGLGVVDDEALTAEAVESEDAADNMLDKGTVEILGFPGSQPWALFNKRRGQRSKAVHLAEGDGTREEIMASLEQYLRGDLGLSKNEVLLGSVWTDHVAEVEQATAERALELESMPALPYIKGVCTCETGRTCRDCIDSVGEMMTKVAREGVRPMFNTVAPASEATLDDVLWNDEGEDVGDFEYPGYEHQELFDGTWAEEVEDAA